jgi:hypothetical protein
MNNLKVLLPHLSLASLLRGGNFKKTYAKDFCCNNPRNECKCIAGKSIYILPYIAIIETIKNGY